MAIELNWEVEQGFHECDKRDGKDTVSVYPDGSKVFIHGDFDLTEIEQILSKMKELQLSLEKNCGTCKWWAADSHTKLPNGRHYSDCMFFMPASIAEVKRFPMLDVEGANCPVWEKKE